MEHILKCISEYFPSFTETLLSCPSFDTDFYNDFLGFIFLLPEDYVNTV